ncbi:MarR family winged helix-turn-helix transcriptional regulator [Devosia sp.]|uniref:MarR family winged helix-turn-helix transcriptional regulator n=1 Tax=Devosia sp. TaxID=1871048 RepID=UPI003BAB8D7D
MNKPSSRYQSEHQIMLERLQIALREVVDIAQTARDRAAKALDLHPTDLACIGYLQRVGMPVSPKQIITHLNLTSGSGTALLDRLETVGFIRRLPNPEDRRSLLIELDIDKAAEPLERLKAIEQSYNEVTQSFSAENLHTIARFMEDIARFAKTLAD